MFSVCKIFTKIRKKRQFWDARVPSIITYAPRETGVWGGGGG